MSFLWQAALVYMLIFNFVKAMQKDTGDRALNSVLKAFPFLPKAVHLRHLHLSSSMFYIEM